MKYSFFQDPKNGSSNIYTYRFYKLEMRYGWENRTLESLQKEYPSHRFHLIRSFNA